jgi:hypothetical protein
MIESAPLPDDVQEPRLLSYNQRCIREFQNRRGNLEAGSAPILERDVHREWLDLFRGANGKNKVDKSSEIR